MTTPVPGWYPDPEGTPRQRFWDGVRWTDQYAAAEKAVPISLWMALGALVFLLLCCGGGCLAVGAGLGGDSEDDSETNAAQRTPDQTSEGQTATVPATEDPFRGDQDNPVVVHPGKAFDIRGFKYLPGWRVTTRYGDVEIEGLRLKNTRDESDSAFVDFRFWRGSEVLAEVTCTSDGDIEPGTTVSLDCGGFDAMPSSYERLTIQDSF